MKSYSPTDNVKPQAYPNILVTAGLHDPRVGYWEPAKLVARLRELKMDDNLLMLKTELGAGHFSVTGRCVAADRGAWCRVMLAQLASCPCACICVSVCYLPVPGMSKGQRGGYEQSHRRQGSAVSPQQSQGKRCECTAGISNWMLHRTSPVGEPTRGSLGKATPHRNKMTNRTNRPVL
jgi:hypothetical protein